MKTRAFHGAEIGRIEELALRAGSRALPIASLAKAPTQQLLHLLSNGDPEVLLMGLEKV